ncbi:hypothetical protein [Mucilaginibacter sp.]|uniref:hypothetical protein n=1 Tax=Mucilaginibacter sp. TaxID=1882438 RepID=UPI003D0AD07A
MKANFKAPVLFESGYIDLSEKLRDELELKIDTLYKQNCFTLYVNNTDARENIIKNDFLSAYLLSKVPKDYVLSGKLLQGIKTWFNMYYDDRLSVIDKFKICYQNTVSPKNINEKQVVTIAFCKFLINELLGTLVDSRWQHLVYPAD